MKYRTKIDTPWCKKGTTLTRTNEHCHRYRLPDGSIQYLCPNNYPDLFEPIEEKPEVEILEAWMIDIFARWALNPGIKTYQETVAQALIDAGVDVSKITKGK